MKKQLATAIALALGVGIGSASAATIGSLTSTYPIFLWEDDDIELMYQDDNGNGLLDIGDTLRGIVEITAMYDTSAGTAQVADLEGLGRTDNHLAGVFETEVKDITTLTDGAGNITGYDYFFGVVGADTGTIITFYEENVDDLNLFDCGTSIADCEDQVTDGTEVIQLGFNGDPDEFWVALNVQSNNPDVGLIESQTTSFNFGTFNAGLSVISSAIGNYAEGLATTGLEPGAADGNDLVQWTLGGTVKGTCTEGAAADGDIICEQHIGSYYTGDGETGDKMYTATSDADLEARRVIPEPGSLALLGLGLLGLGAAKLRRRG